MRKSCLFGGQTSTNDQNRAKQSKEKFQVQARFLKGKKRDKWKRNLNNYCPVNNKQTLKVNN